MGITLYKTKMFTKPPTPEEFKELKDLKFIRKTHERLEWQTKKAAEEVLILEKNNQYQIQEIIQAMHKGDDSVQMDARSVKTRYTFGDVETARLNTVVAEAFPLFDMTVISNNNLDQTYEVRWFAKVKPVLKETPIEIKDDNLTHSEAKEWLKKYSCTQVDLTNEEAKEWLKIYHKAL